MGSSSSIMRPQELVDFRKLNTAIDNVDIPARPENRTVTDKKGFVLFGVAILILIPFLIYTLVHADIRHLIYGSDDCGNFCGMDNPSVPDRSCSGKDNSFKPYVDRGSCVEQCEHGIMLWRDCWEKPLNQHFRGKSNKKDWRTLSRDLNKRSLTHDDNSDEDAEAYLTKAVRQSREEWWKYPLSAVFTIVVGLLALVLLRFVPAVFVWGVVVFSMGVLLVITGGLWYSYFQFKQPNPERIEQSNPLLPIVVVWTIIAAVVLIVFFVLFKRIGLVVQLYKETTKVMAAIPMIMFVPILTTFLQLLVFVGACVTTFFMFTSQTLVHYEPNIYRYEIGGITIFTIIFNIFVALWAMSFIGGIQYMTISGSTSRWFFSRNKDYLDSPICSSFVVTVKYHLGTIAFGSFLILLFAFVKAILRSIFRNACCRCMFDICCGSMEIILKFISENSYIETAIHGQSYLRSAKRATKLLLTNASSVIAINCVGDFVLGVVVFLVAVLATAISFALFMNLGAAASGPTLVCFIVNVIIIAIIFGTFQTIIDTLFICFCEDSVLNDGMSRPYYMSRGLMEFVENSKKVYGEKNGR